MKILNSFISINQKVTIPSNEPINEVQHLIEKLINWKNVISSNVTKNVNRFAQEKLNFRFQSKKKN